MKTFIIMIQRVRIHQHLSSVFNVGNKYDAIQVPITVGIKPTAVIPDSLKAKALLISIGDYGKISPEGGEWKGDFLTAKPKHFGTFAMLLDTVPPTIVKSTWPTTAEYCRRHAYESESQ